MNDDVPFFQKGTGPKKQSGSTIRKLKKSAAKAVIKHKWWIGWPDLRISVEERQYCKSILENGRFNQNDEDKDFEVENNSNEECYSKNTKRWLFLKV